MLVARKEKIRNKKDVIKAASKGLFFQKEKGRMAPHGAAFCYVGKRLKYLANSVFAQARIPNGAELDLERILFYKYFRFVQKNVRIILSNKPRRFVVQNSDTNSSEKASSRFSVVNVDSGSAPAGVLWFGGWMFTIGYAKLGFWSGCWALVTWPCYLGRHLSGG